jgi:hypothetical protein
MVVNMQVAASKRRIFVKNAQKTSSALQRRAGGEGRASNPSARSAAMKFFASFCFQTDKV